MKDTDAASADNKDFLADVRDKFERAAEREEENRERGLADLKFARLGEQWPDKVKLDREAEGRPCLTINKLPAFIRQVVNEARQNKPAITVQPVDSGADPETAEIMSGLIRNIETTSNASVAYDTAVEGATSNGFGYIGVNTAYASDDTFDQDIVIERKANPFAIYGDPDSQAADSSDWNCAFEIEMMSRERFRARWKDAQEVDWDATGYTGLASPWCDGDQIMVAAYWHREIVEKEIVALTNGTVVAKADFEARPDDFAGLTIVGQPRVVQSHKVTQYMLTGAEVLDTIPWPGKYIPLIPVYGDEVNVEGKRQLFSLVHFGKDSQREYNYHRSAATEMVALAPKAPFIGPVGAFDGDDNWSTANSESHPYLEYSGTVAPARQPFTGVPVGEMQLALSASDDMKATIGLFDPSLGAKSNVTSGVGLRQQQRQGDVATFHFEDNLSRAILHTGRIVLDLIPKVYPTKRVLRVIGQDQQPKTVQVSPDAAQANAQAQQGAADRAWQQASMAPPEQQQAAYQAALQQEVANISRIYDITAGKYDLTVKAGPSFSTQREAARAEIVEVIRSVPASAPILGPMYLRNSDWPGADEAADKIEAQQVGAEPDQAAQQQMAAMQAQLQQLAARNAELEQDQALKAQENQIKGMEAQTKAFEAETDRIRALNEANQPAPITYA